MLNSVGSEFFQDSDEPIGSTPARIPAYTVVDLAADYDIAAHWRLLAGVSNLTNRRYYSRVFIAGGLLEPAASVAAYAGAAYEF
jgi:Fe(3+) dicitrate transport protein